MGVNLKKQTEIVLYVCRIRFSTFPSYYFPLCMLITYNRLRKLRELFEITSVPNDFIEKCLETCNSRFCDDINNCVLVNKDFLNECGLRSDFVRLPNRKLAFLIGARVRSKTALVSETFKHNLKDVDEIQLKGTDFKNIPVAKEIDLSLINTNHDLSNALIDGLVKNYFRTPKFVHRNDLIAIKFRKYAPEVYYTSAKFLGDFVHFRCNNAIFDGSEPGGLCVVGETTIKQSANCQSYVAPSDRILCEFGDDFEDCAINRCPFGLNNYLERLERIVNPFLRRKQIDLKPVFLLKGTKGSGKTLMVATLASKYGLHFYSTGSFDINSTVYAQTETKIRNIFFKAKLSSPCVLAITNFENFGKNNEGQYDERIINFFKTQLDDLFANNPFPIILMCISNAKEIPSNLGQIFLETIEMSGPDENQRLDNLKWILRTRKIAPQANLEAVARKTRGFLFEDLRALVCHAQMDGLKNGRPVDDESFDRGLDLMQSKYNQGLGAPKIPKVQWSDVGGLMDVKREIIRTINLPLRHPELLQNSGLKRSGILLYGPPGTGKTLMAKAVATECNLCFLSVKGPELLNMYVGQSEHNVREVFERAREASPCIIFFDELDSLAPNRGVSGDSGGVMDRVVSQLLAEMDGLDQGATVFIIGATNRPDLIDPALLRPGRFDKLLYVGPCVDFDSKLGVLEALTRKFNLGEGVDLKQLIAMCPENITGADFYGLSSNAWLSAVRHLMDIIDKDELLHYSHDDVIVTMEDFKFALRDLKPSLKTQDLAYFEQLQKQFKN